MSGRKTTYTYVREDELSRLRRQAASASNLQTCNRALQQLSQKNDAALRTYRQRLESMNSTVSNLNQRLKQQGKAATKEAQALRSQLNRTIKQANDRFEALSKENEQRVSALQRGFNDQLAQTRSDFAQALDETRADVVDAISSNNRRIMEAITQNNAQIESDMQALRSDVASELEDVHRDLDRLDAAVRRQAQNQQALVERATEYERMARILLEELQTNHPVDLLCPGQLRPVLQAQTAARRELTEAQRNPANAAVAHHGTRAAMEDAYELYQRVLVAEQEWQVRRQAVRQLLDTVSAQLEASRSLGVPDEPNASVDVDTWTGGDLSAIESRVGALVRELENPSSPPSFEDLDAIQAAAQQASAEIDEAAGFALEAFASSQDRSDVAGDIADQLLTRAGLELVDHSFQGNDQRNAHRIHLRNHQTGFEVVVTQTPEVQPDGSIANRMEADIISFGDQNRDRGASLAREILSSLGGLGFDQGEVETVPGFEHAASNRTEVADIERWRTERAPAARPVHQAQPAQMARRTA